MTITKPDIHTLVIKKLEASYKPLFDKSRQPLQYGEMVDALVQTIHDRAYGVQALAEGMRLYVHDWKKHRWPTYGELQPYLEDAAKNTSLRRKLAGVGERPDETSNKADWSDIKHRMKAEFLARVVEFHGDP